MNNTLKFNPVKADLKDLTSIKKQVSQMFLKETNRKVYIGFGETKSPFKTKGLDFQEVRMYQPGDDIRQIDWKLTAKYGKPFTKLYTDEKERQVFLICDMRTRMKFASVGAFKSVVCAHIATFLSYLAENKHDRLGFTILSSSFIETVEAYSAKESLQGLLSTLEKVSTPTDLKNDQISLLQALEKSDALIRSGSLVFILSDFSDWNLQCDAIIRRWSNKNICSFVHIYDKMEQELPKGIFPISDGAEIALLDTVSHHFPTVYNNIFQQRVSQLEKTAELYQCGYLPLRTDENILNKTAMYSLGVQQS